MHIRCYNSYLMNKNSSPKLSSSHDLIIGLVLKAFLFFPSILTRGGNNRKNIKMIFKCLSYKAVHGARVDCRLALDRQNSSPEFPVAQAQFRPSVPCWRDVARVPVSVPACSRFANSGPGCWVWASERQLGASEDWGVQIICNNPDPAPPWPVLGWPYLASQQVTRGKLATFISRVLNSSKCH